MQQTAAKSQARPSTSSTLVLRINNAGLSSTRAFMEPRLPIQKAYPLKLLGGAVDDGEAAQLAGQQQHGGP